MFEDITEKLFDRKRVFDGKIIRIDHTKALLPDGTESMREIAVHNGASAIVPVDKDGNVYLVRQYRAPLERVTLEIPAGKLDTPDEDRHLCAVRELKEETGFSAKKWTHLTDMATTPGFCTEVISIYLAEGLESGETDLDDDEFLNLIKMPLSEAIDMCASGKIGDSKTICGLLLAEKIICGR